MLIALVLSIVLIVCLLFYIVKMSSVIELKTEEAQNNYSIWFQTNLELQSLKHQYTKDIDQARKDSVKKSRATINGQISEHLAPFLSDKYNPKDYRFLGTPIDYLICSGATNILDNKQDHIDEIILLEIKTGNANLTKTQRRIRDAILEGKVSFAIYNPETKELKEYKNGTNNITQKTIA